MVGSIYFINMPYSSFTKSKGRPVLVMQQIDHNDLLVLPLTSNLMRDGIKITNDDVESGSLKKDSIIAVPKLTAIDSHLIMNSKLIASLKKDSFSKIKTSLCQKLQC